jgi:hypothetical protein
MAVADFQYIQNLNCSDGILVQQIALSSEISIGTLQAVHSLFARWKIYESFLLEESLLLWNYSTG